MTYQDKFNKERYYDPTPYAALKNIERKGPKKNPLREDWDFWRGDLYLADLNYGVIGLNGNYVPGGIRPVVLLQSNVGNFFATTLIIVPISSKFWRIRKMSTHYEIQNPHGLSEGSIALGEQIAIIDKKQCLKYLGKLSRQETDAIKDAALYGLSDEIDIPEVMEAP